MYKARPKQTRDQGGSLSVIQRVSHHSQRRAKDISAALNATDLRTQAMLHEHDTKGVDSRTFMNNFKHNVNEVFGVQDNLGLLVQLK